MNAYRAKGAKTFKGRVYGSGERVRVMSFGTRDPKEQRAITAMLKRFRQKGRRRYDVLDAILDEHLTVIDVYEADAQGTLHELMARVASRRAAAAEVDLSRMVDVWAKAGARPTYVMQVRRLMPAGTPFPRSAFTRGCIRAFLDGLTQVPRKRTLAEGESAPDPIPAADSTKNRYRAALSAFAKWLVERELLEANPVHAVTPKAEPAPRVVYLEGEDPRRLITALPPGQHRFVSALMYSTGLEISAIKAMTRRFVNLDERSFHAFPWLATAKGKTKYRSRIVVATQDDLWPMIEAYTRALPPNAPLVTLSEEVLLRMVQRRVRLLGLPPDYTLHDWRHTYAVEWLKGGGDHQVLRHQLGHSPRSTLIYTTYGTWLVKPADIRAGAPKARADASTRETATNSATSPRNEVKSHA